jgi:Sugar (pentulose and hexulose) kinases
MNYTAEAKQEYYLGFDVGTSGLKCCIVDTQGNIFLRCSQEYSYEVDQFGKAEQNPDVWYNTFLDVLKRIRVERGFDLKKIVRIGASGQMRGVTFVGKNLEPVRNSIQWNDTRCREEADEIRRSNFEPVRQITCNPVNPMCTLPKLMWVRNHDPKAWERTRHIMYPKDYINMKLTGIVATEPTDASGSLMYDMWTDDWSGSIIGQYGINRDILPEVRRSFDVVGNVTREAAAATGFLQGIPVIAGGSDATVEFYSAGIRDESRCKIRLGSSSSICTLSSLDRWTPQTKHYCWKSVKGDKVVLDINTSACAASVKWLRDVFYSEYPKSGDTFEVMDQEAGMVEAGAAGLMYHPYIQGENAPYWNAKLSGMFTGMRMSHTRKEFTKAVYEGVSFSLLDVFTSFPEVYKDCTGYVLLGGGTKAKGWVGTLVNVLGKPAMIDQTAEASHGAAVMAMESAGITGEDIDHGRQYVNYEGKVHEAYLRLFEKYKALADDSNSKAV